MNSPLLGVLDKAMVALQAAGTAQRLYGPNHPAATRQLELAGKTLALMLASVRELRLIRLDNALLFDDTDLPSCAVLAREIIPALARHGIEWIEFRDGLNQRELLALLEQIDRTSDESQHIGTEHVRVGGIGRGIDSAAASGSEARGVGGALPTPGMAMVSHLNAGEHAEKLKEVWSRLRAGGEVQDQQLADLVESIRLAVTVGADVCNQLAQVKHHDEYTFVHTVNVAILSAALGEAVGMTHNQVFDLILAALLHDVGKQRTPIEILNKPGKLDELERRRMERHTLDGAAILIGRRGVPDVAPIVAFEHHANVDGTGYPNLGHKARPHLASQIVHVADIFDALRTNRPYRAAMDEAKVRSILLQCSDKSFDGALVDLFLERVVKLSVRNDQPAAIPVPPTSD
jgi:putative nucleotidyltransferase with HDIG domain